MMYLSYIFTTLFVLCISYFFGFFSLHPHVPHIIDPPSSYRLCPKGERDRGYFMISVPIPLSVNISRRRACGMDASRICAFRTPPFMALMHAFAFGIIPESIIPCLMSLPTSAVLSV